MPQDIAERENLFSLPEIGGAWVRFVPAKGHKCARCWMILNEVGSHKDHPALCDRCHDAVTA